MPNIPKIKIGNTTYDIKDANLSAYNARNLGSAFLTKTSSSSGEMSYTWNSNGTCRVVGNTLDETSRLNVLLNSPNAMPEGIVPGQTYYADFVTSDYDNGSLGTTVNLQVILYPGIQGNQSGYDVYSFIEPGFFTVPKNTIGMIVRLRVLGGLDNVNVTVYKCDILSAPSNMDAGLPLVRKPLRNDDFDTIVEPGVYYTLSNRVYPNCPVTSKVFGRLEVNRFAMADYQSNPVVVQIFEQIQTGITYRRYKTVSTNTWQPWVQSNSWDIASKEISILFVGNSLTQDGIAYLPYLLKMYYPYVSFRFYMWYNGGKTLKQHYEDYFLTDTPCQIFSVAENEYSWTNHRNDTKMSDILSTYKIDVVCMQEYFNSKKTYTVSDLVDWNNCQEYIRSHYSAGNNGLEFVSLFHAPKRNNADNIFDLTVAGNNLILQNTIADDMIPNGIAVYRALSTALDSLGDQGHLSPDGTHTQEGLPCLLQTYVTACWIFDKLGIAKSIYGCSMRMTTDIYNTLDVPGPNLGTGVITGTNEQNRLAQEVAIKAYKEGKYYVQNNQFVPAT